MRRRIRSSICLLGSVAYCGFAQDDTRFARRLLIDKIWEFIDAFDYEHSSPRAVLFCCKTRRNRGCGAEHSVWHSATSRERSDCETGGIARHETISAEAVRALACGCGTVRGHQTLL